MEAAPSRTLIGPFCLTSTAKDKNQFKPTTNHHEALVFFLANRIGRGRGGGGAVLLLYRHLVCERCLVQRLKILQMY